MFGGLDEWLDGSGWVWVVSLSHRGELGLEPYGSRLGWVARDNARELVEVGSNDSCEGVGNQLGWVRLEFGVGLESVLGLGRPCVGLIEVGCVLICLYVLHITLCCVLIFN